MTHQFVEPIIFDVVIVTFCFLETVSNQQIVTYQYFTLEAMIIIYVHIRDIINGLIASEVTNRDDFEWNRC